MNLRATLLNFAQAYSAVQSLSRIIKAPTKSAEFPENIPIAEH